ncbi:MAG TPA: hypothetical protein VLX28_14815 [Thermoanaerobaculia bacterium]|nr:hypothetical protein [Thermoanaerobaculia bacterium]
MNLRALTSAAIRFFALYILFEAIGSAGEAVFVSGMFRAGGGSGAAQMVGGLVFNLVFQLAVASFLLARTDVVTGWVLRGPASGEETVSVTARELAGLTFCVAGLIFLVSGLERLLGQTANWYFHQQGLVGGSMRRLDLPSLVASGVKAIAGIGLLLAARARRS